MFASHSKNYERISIKFGIETQFTITEILKEGFFDIFHRKKNTRKFKETYLNYRCKRKIRFLAKI